MLVSLKWINSSKVSDILLNNALCFTFRKLHLQVKLISSSISLLWQSSHVHSSNLMWYLPVSIRSGKNKLFQQYCMVFYESDMVISTVLLVLFYLWHIIFQYLYYTRHNSESWDWGNIVFCQSRKSPRQKLKVTLKAVLAKIKLNTFYYLSYIIFTKESDNLYRF